MELSLLFLDLGFHLGSEVKGEVDKGFPGGREVGARLTGYIGAKLSFEGLVDDTGTFGVGPRPIDRGGVCEGLEELIRRRVGMEKVDKSLPILVSVLLFGTGPRLERIRVSLLGNS